MLATMPPSLYLSIYIPWSVRPGRGWRIRRLGEGEVGLIGVGEGGEQGGGRGRKPGPDSRTTQGGDCDRTI